MIVLILARAFEIAVHAVTLTQQLEYYREWQIKVANLVGKGRANAVFSGGFHLLSAASSDFIQNYYINPFLNGAYSHDQFSDILMKSYSTIVQVMQNSIDLLYLIMFNCI